MEEELKQLQVLRGILSERLESLLKKEEEGQTELKETRETIVSLGVLLEKISLMKSRIPRFPDTPTGTDGNATRLSEVFGDSSKWRKSEGRGETARQIHNKEKKEEKSLKKEN